ncbi:hypothetical protein ACFLXJ_06650 [Chloroflexota bacterium]
MRKGKEEEPQSDNTEIEQTEVQQEESQESNFAKVDIVTSEKKVTMSAPVKEFEDLKNSFKSMMVAFADFMEVAGLEIGKDETITKINTLSFEFEQMRKDLQLEQTKIRDGLVPRNEFNEFKTAIEAEDDKRRAESVPRSEFEELKAATEERAARANEDYVTRGEFEKFRAAVREVI